MNSSAPRSAALLAGLLLLLLVLAPAKAMGEKAEELREAIGDSQKQAEQKKQELTRLTRKERKLYGSLASMEDDIEALQEKLRAQRSRLEDIRKEEAWVQDSYFALKKDQDKTMTQLKKLLQSIWPLHLQGVAAKLRGAGEWSSLDRRFTWLAAIYNKAEEDMRRMGKQARLLSMSLAEQERLRRQTEAKIADIDATADALLSKKLAMLSEIKKIRSLKMSKEEELSAILSAIHDLNYQLKSLINRRFSAHKGYLAWPARGKVVTTYSPGAKPPRRGLGLELPKDAPVRSVFWGKVVHNNVLRGFGKVVIIYHGEDYYSLYSFLGESRVRMGQEVEKDETIGLAGYYPKAHAYGLYFELRFHQKAINPSVWLSH